MVLYFALLKNKVNLSFSEFLGFKVNPSLIKTSFIFKITSLRTL